MTFIIWYEDVGITKRYIYEPKDLADQNRKLEEIQTPRLRGFCLKEDPMYGLEAEEMRKNLKDEAPQQ